MKEFIMKHPNIKIVTGSLLIILLTPAAPPAAIATAAETLTLEQAKEIAIRNNPGLKAADAQVKAADAGVLRSRSGFLPKITLSETWSKTDNPLMVLGTKLNRESVSQTDFSPSVINHPDPVSNYNTRISVTQPVFNGGREYIGRSQAKLALGASRQDRERARQETVFNVVKAYYGLLLAQKNHRVAQQSLETSAANVKLAQARYKAGAVLQSDVLRAKVQYAEVKEMLTKTENGVKLAGAGLNFAMGVPQGEEYRITGELAVRGMEIDLSRAISEAEKRRPDLIALEMNRRNAEKSVGMARSDYLPSLNVTGQADWNSDQIAGSDGRSWAVMAVLQWNLFDGHVTRANVKEAAATSSRIKSLEEQTRSAVQLQVRQAYYTMTSTLDRIATTDSSVAEAEEGLRIIQKRYETGMTSFVDVLGAENALIRARTAALQAVYDNNVGVAELQLAMGTL